MKPIAETDAKIRQRLLRECAGIVTERQRQEELAPQYFEYVDSRQRSTGHWKRVENIARFFGLDRIAKIAKSDETGILREMSDNLRQADRLPLWKAMREYLREEGEAKVGDIQAYLESKDYTRLSRQTIESAIKRHRETFIVRTTRHERIVFLREILEGEASSEEE